FLDVLRQCAGLAVLGMEETQSTATLTDTKYHFFISSTTALSAVLNAAHIGFIHFDDTAELGGVTGCGHSRANAMAQVPCGFVTLLSEHPINLTSRDAFLGFGHQVSNEEPLRQWQVGVMEHGAHSHRELVVA